MKRRISRFGLVLSVPYLLLWVGGFAYVLYRLQFQPVGSELLGVWLILLASPWGMMSVDMLGRLGGMWQVTAALAGFCLLNTLLLYAFGALVGWFFSLLFRRK